MTELQQVAATFCFWAKRLCISFPSSASSWLSARQTAGSQVWKGKRPLAKGAERSLWGHGAGQQNGREWTKVELSDQGRGSLLEAPCHPSLPGHPGSPGHAHLGPPIQPPWSASLPCLRPWPECPLGSVSPKRSSRVKDGHSFAAENEA